MTKMLKIDNCGECPFVGRAFNGIELTFRCAHDDVPISKSWFDNDKIIQEWCPLEDAED